MAKVALIVTVLLLLTFQAPLSIRSQPLEGLVHIRFQLDVRVFATTAAINAAGFDVDVEDLESNPVRKLVRERLSRLDADLQARLRKFYTGHDIELDAIKQQSKYLSFSLVLNGPPSFSLLGDSRREPPPRTFDKTPVIPVEAQSLIGFERLVKETWEKAELARLWEEVRPFYVREVESYRPHIHRMILECLRYMRTEARLALDRQIFFTPDLLNGYGIVNARNIGHDYFLLVGPTRTQSKSMHSVRHEYLHFMIDPLVAKYAGHLPEPEPFLKLVRERSNPLGRYEGDFTLMVTESMIHMLELQLDKKSREQKDLTILADYDEGLILAPYFDEALQKFEKNQGSLQEFFPFMIQGIRLETEKTRPASLTQLKREIETRQLREKKDSDARTLEREEIRKKLVAANELLLATEFEKAQVLLEEVLRRDPANPNALYAMAQLAAKDQELDQALELYELAAKNAGESAWLKAWSFVRRGNIYQFQEKPELAKREWSRVLELTGDLRGAAEAAKKALAEP